MINPGWQIKTIFTGRIYEMYKIINPEGREVWCGTLDGLDFLLRSVVEDLATKHDAPDWAMNSLRALRDKLRETILRVKGGAS